MESERALSATSSNVSRDAVSMDLALRSQLERQLPAAYRLATVILGDAAEAEDVTHDAIEHAWKARAQLRDPDRFEAWFQRILVNGCRDRLRRRRFAPKLIALRSDGAERVTRDMATDAADRDALSIALEQLDPDRRIVIVMRFFLDLEVAEIARRLGTRPGTVKSRLHRGLADLRYAWETDQ